MGKPLHESVNEIRGAISRIKFFLKNSEETLKPQNLSKDENMGEEIQFEPLGVIGNISAWNYPYLIGVNVFIPALICGNTVLYKPSEYTSLTGLEIQRIFTDIGLPKNAFRCPWRKIYWTRDPKTFFKRHIFYRFIQNGLSINQEVSKNLPVGLELGGKDPLYVQMMSKI